MLTGVSIEEDTALLAGVLADMTTASGTEAGRGLVFTELQAGAPAVASLWPAVQGKPNQGSFRQPGVHLCFPLAAHTPGGPEA